MTELFNNPEGEKLAIPEVVKEVVRYMRAVPDREYAINIGTDSQLLQGGKANFVTAIVVRRIGNGGKYFWRQVNIGNKFHTLRDRMIQEVMISLDLATGLLEMLQKEIDPNLNWKFEIHADIGENGDTKAVIQEITGMIRAYNFEPITKPLSYAATNVADKHV